MPEKDKIDILLELVKNIDEKVDKFEGRLDVIETHNQQSRKNVYDRLGKMEMEVAIIKKEIYGNGKAGICEKMDKITDKFNELNAIRFKSSGALMVIFFLIQFLINKFLMK
jgi:hypothetical protein